MQKYIQGALVVDAGSVSKEAHVEVLKKLEQDSSPLRKAVAKHFIQYRELILPTGPQRDDL